MELQYNCRVQYVLHNSFKILKMYKWLLDSFVLDYFVEDHWTKLPQTWSRMLNNIEPPELCGLLSFESPQCHSVVWPLSLLALQAARRCLVIPREKSRSSLQWPSCECACCQTCSALTVKLDRCGLSDWASTEQLESSLWHTQVDLRNLHIGVNDVIRNSCEAQHFVRDDKDTSTNDGSLGLMNSSFLSAKLERVFEKHVKPKKRHEIFKMAQVAAWTARAQGCHCIVDVGSGIGHLARMLTYGFGLKVCCLEAQNILLTQARKLDKELEVTLSKYISVEELSQYSRPVHLNVTLNSDFDPADFVNALSTAFGDISPSDLTFGIVGLHPCGDLGPILLKLFQHCPGASFINIVGCCYMKISRGP